MQRTKSPLKATVEKRKTHKHISIDINEQLKLCKLYSSSNWLSINKDLLRIYGPNTTIFISQVVDLFKMWAEQGCLQSDGSFFIRTDDIAKNTGMSPYQIRKCKEEMKKSGVITTMMKGVPQKEFYFIDLKMLEQKPLEDYYSKNLRIKPKETLGLNIKELDEYNNNISNKNKSNKKDIHRKEQVELLMDKEEKNLNPDQFEEFWSLYPRKINKPGTRKKWEVLSKLPKSKQPLFQDIINAVSAQTKMDQWQDPQFIPHPSTWLNQERWNDEILSSRKKPNRNGIITSPDTGINAKVQVQSQTRTDSKGEPKQ